MREIPLYGCRKRLSAVTPSLTELRTWVRVQDFRSRVQGFKLRVRIRVQSFTMRVRIRVLGFKMRYQIRVLGFELRAETRERRRQRTWQGATGAPF